jgi:ATP-dependent DNA ligase
VNVSAFSAMDRHRSAISRKSSGFIAAACYCSPVSIRLVQRVKFWVLRMVKRDMPGFIKPQLATLRSKAPSGPQWLHEIKFDGYRIQLNVDAGKRRAFTRNSHDWGLIGRKGPTHGSRSRACRRANSRL